jgi:two-component system phosphate regulon sensor histidine kinase PhoR
MTVEKQKKALDIIRESTVRLTNFINNILDLAKIKAGRMEMKKMPTDMFELAEEIVQLFRPMAAKDGKDLLNGVPQNLPKIDADGERIKQVIINLLGNALKFTPQGATITIGGALVTETMIEATVADTGVGIPADEIGKVFEKFYQVKGGALKKPKGTGLGLAIVAEIIKLHNGAITVESEFGKGTTFRFTIPVWRNYDGQ